MIKIIQSTINKNLIQNATDFIHTCYHELGLSAEKQIERIDKIHDEIERTGTYVHEPFEMEHGAKMAWRNSNKCIGRLLWNTLQVFDARNIHTVEQAYEKLLEHIKFATNDGKIRSTITVFPQRKNGKDAIRVWNHQLIRYAGYEENGEIIGDSMSVEFTKTCERLGWKGDRTAFDVLPLVIQEHGQEPKVFDIPKELIKEVPITHPEYDEVEELQIKWYAVPIISDMRLEIGGIDYPLAPFNGWYMGTEIGARNLADTDRYNLLPKFAEIMALNTNINRSLWIDKALVELNIAVLHSYQKHGVTLVDHHTAAKQFERFEKNEAKHGRPVTGNWTWLIPTLSPATTHIYHKPYNNEMASPNYFYQTDITFD